MNYLISIFPICLYLLLIKGMDGFSIARWGRIAECFIWGVVSCISCYYIGKLMPEHYGFGFPLLEEVVKVTPMIVAIHRKRFAFFVETLSYGAAIGAGFAILENILYLSLYHDLTIGEAALRGISTSLLHIGCTALLSSMVLVAFRISKGKSVFLIVLYDLVAALPSMAIHFTYNLFLLPPFFQMIVCVIIFIGLFILTYSIDEKLIHKWLDLCITNDIALYSSIKQGKLQSTNAGQYLLMAKERFAPEVFFDICVFLGLYLEMSIASKSRMIMKEAGIDEPLSQQEKEQFKNKVEEIKELRRSMGKSGTMLLKPFITIKQADKWAMKELLCK